MLDMLRGLRRGAIFEEPRVRSRLPQSVHRRVAHEAQEPMPNVFACRWKQSTTVDQFIIQRIFLSALEVRLVNLQSISSLVTFLCTFTVFFGRVGYNRKRFVPALKIVKQHLPDIFIGEFDSKIFLECISQLQNAVLFTDSDP